MKKVTFTQDYNKKRGPTHGSEQWARGQDFQRRNQNYSNDGFGRNSPTTYQSFSPRPIFAYGNDRPDNRRSYGQRPNQQIRGMTEIDLGMVLSTTRMGTGETMETFLVLHRLKGETTRRLVHTANQEVISPTTLLSADLTIHLRLVLRPTNKNFRKTITRQHLIWFVSP